MSISWVLIFSRGYLVGTKFLLVGTSWVQDFSLGYFVDTKFFSWVFEGPKTFLVGISWATRKYRSEEYEYCK